MDSILFNTLKLLKMGSEGADSNQRHSFLSAIHKGRRFFRGAVMTSLVKTSKFSVFSSTVGTPPVAKEAKIAAAKTTAAPYIDAAGPAGPAPLSPEVSIL
jgi:hypothetical protein